MCDSCYTVEDAKKAASKYTYPLNCETDLGPNGQGFLDEYVQCSSKERRVVILNSVTKKIYGFRVSHQNIDPWAVRVISRQLDSEEVLVYKNMIALRRAFFEAVHEASFNQNAHIKSFRQRTLSSENYGQTCPTDTAFDTLHDPDKMHRLKVVATGEIGLNLMNKINAINMNPSAANETISISTGLANYSVTTAKNGRKATFLVSFENSEIVGPRVTDDFLLFDVTILAYTPNNMPVLRFTLNKESRVANTSLSELAGMSGSLSLTNKCLKDKLDKLVEDGDLTKTESSRGGGPSDGALGGNSDIGGGAIPTKVKPCLACHGETINSVTAELIHKNSPNDLAIGYKAGDIRGAFSLIKAL